MLTKGQIRNYIENAGSDILIEKFVSLLDNDNDIIYRPKGLFNKIILNDTGRVIKKKGHVFIDLNRAGFYDILPLGLFHNKVDEINNQSRFIDQVESEKNTFRNLFLPFDSELFSTSVKIEKECKEHFKCSFDSEITISLMKFFRIFDEVDLLSIYEILFIDCLTYIGKDWKDTGHGTLTDRIFLNDISPYEIMVNMLELSQAGSKIKRFLNMLPMAANNVGNIQRIEKILRHIFDKEIFIGKTSRKHKHNCPPKTNILGNAPLNTNLDSFVLGNYMEIDQEIIDIKIKHNNENSVLQSQYIDGCYGKFLQLILSYFFPFETECRIKFYTNKANNDSDPQDFKLEPEPGRSFKEMPARRNEILKQLTSVSPYKNSFYSSLEEDMQFLVKEYFESYSDAMGVGAVYTYLSMNTKI